jgi:hypothetical protein
MSFAFTLITVVAIAIVLAGFTMIGLMIWEPGSRQ